MVPLLVTGDSILVFDVEHVRVLREHGIVGVLIGSLPKAPQQNVFLGLPLQLSIYEAIWLIQAGFAILLDGAKYSEFLAGTNSLSPAVVSLLNSVQYAVTLDTHKPEADADLGPYTILPQSMIEKYCTPKSEFQKPAEFWHFYFAFKYLRELQYFMMPGLRFGGIFVAYPGDPLKFHSHLIVKALKPEEEIDLLKIVTSGRLATAVKKSWLLVAEKKRNNEDEKPSMKDSPEMLAFSIEWAGFG
ncbi:tRNA-intron endonuclease catalytic domain-like protein [Metschnikowia bicuspidata var. bicuspidata NRRL YB-4993]|uniref:tRNA-splicing endonuclease subunit Sen34 n=1 Tax=Metschnikowia bicuspidata var. bicuspidata NRRL YB-4993 TaxID=869754 RepID=A0A1A0HF99_9ASCO|nr:tRNA-intron endonuclease catalytic domain-like protein [Metschnikowia bicuspidata var. bicuspidata NRRL YB-4993]OBA22671.1 tRNA-intron endonuclease catalytic domain-like protein [Metschnikowia bicuspidata var. bicuspidata NRRL YB-4993]